MAEQQEERQVRARIRRDAGKPIAIVHDMRTDPPWDPPGVLPVQFFPARTLPAERRLMLAVLQDALDIHRKYAHVPVGRHRVLADETERWFFADHDSEWPFSFVNLCAALGIDADGVRAQFTTPGGASLPATPERPATAAGGSHPSSAYSRCRSFSRMRTGDARTPQRRKLPCHRLDMSNACRDAMISLPRSPGASTSG